MDPCRVAAVLVESGRLDDATAVSLAVGGACVDTIRQSVSGSRAAAVALVRQAQASEVDTEKRRLAKLALMLDAGNKDAAALAAESSSDPSACAAAESAVDSGEYARASVLYDALKDVETAKECRTTGLVALAENEQSVPSVRITNILVKDLLPTLLLLAACFVAGVLLAAVWRVRVSLAVRRLWSLGLGVFGGVAVLLTLRYHSTHLAPRAWATWVFLVMAALFVAAFAWVLSNYRRDSQPVTVEVTSDAEGEFAALVIAEINDLGSGVAAGNFVPKGTDVNDSGVAAALGSGATDTIVKVLLAVWKAVQLKAADQVVVALTRADDATPGRAVASMHRGSTVVSVRAVEGKSFCLDDCKPTKEELASSHRDVATGVAAAVIASRLNSDPDPSRLYGASNPVSIALCAVAARRLSSEDSAGARKLYRRGVDADPLSIAARYGVLATQLRGYPDKAATKHLLRDLERVEKDLRNANGERADELPLIWRLRWLRATSLVNGALIGLATADWASLVCDDVRDDFRLARESAEWLIQRDPEAVTPADRLLARQLRDNAKAAVAGFDAVLSKTPHPVLSTYPRVAPSGVQFTVACGLAVLRARAVFTKDHQYAEELAAECVERVRLAGGAAPWRSDLLKDPFLRLIADSANFVSLSKEWTKATPYDGVNAFGVLIADIQKMYESPARLAAGLSTTSGAALVRRQFGVDDEVARQWQGAAEWLARNRPTTWINLYQGAGIPDAVSATQMGDVAVLRRLTAAKAVTGVTSIPTLSERVGMRT